MNPISINIYTPSFKEDLKRPPLKNAEESVSKKPRIDKPQAIASKNADAMDIDDFLEQTLSIEDVANEILQYLEFTAVLKLERASKRYKLLTKPYWKKLAYINEFDYTWSFVSTYRGMCLVGLIFEKYLDSNFQKPANQQIECLSDELFSFKACVLNNHEKHSEEIERLKSDALKTEYFLLQSFLLLKDLSETKDSSLIPKIQQIIDDAINKKAGRFFGYYTQISKNFGLSTSFLFPVTENFYKKYRDFNYLRHLLSDVDFKIDQFLTSPESYTPPVLEFLGDRAYSNQRDVEALEYYKRAKKGYGNKTPANVWNSLGLLYQSLRKYNKALSHYKKAEKTNQNNEIDTLTLWECKAKVYSELNQPKEALSTCNKAIASFKSETDVPKVFWRIRAMELMKLKLYKEALVDCERVILDCRTKKADIPSEWRFIRSVCLSRLGQLEKALADINIVINSCTTEASVLSIWWFQRGFCFRKLENYQAAIDDYSRAINSCRSEADVPFMFWDERGLCYSNLCQPQKALDDLSRAIDSLDEADVPAYLWHSRNEVHSALNHLEEAAADYTKAMDAYEREGDLNTLFKFNELARAHAVVQKKFINISSD